MRVFWLFGSHFGNKVFKATSLIFIADQAQACSLRTDYRVSWKPSGLCPAPNDGFRLDQLSTRRAARAFRCGENDPDVLCGQGNTFDPTRKGVTERSVWSLIYRCGRVP